LLYWLVFNVLQTVQQYLILNKGNEPVVATGPAAPAPPKPKDETSRPRRRRRR
jgi:membrane protein insertase Oxa1/YidC/SpoIIIJ